MGWFNKILVQEKKTGNLVDITNLDENHYESFLDAMTKLNAAYLIAKENKSKADNVILQKDSFAPCDHCNMFKMCRKENMCYLRYKENSRYQ